MFNFHDLKTQSVYWHDSTLVRKRTIYFDTVDLDIPHKGMTSINQNKDWLCQH